MRPAIYGLFDPLLGVYGYVGQSVDPERRFGQHLFAGRMGAEGMVKRRRVQLPVTESVERWLGFLLVLDVRPELRVLEPLGRHPPRLWRTVERAWYEHLLASGHPLTNGSATRRTSLLGWRPPFDRQRCPYSARLASAADGGAVDLTVVRARFTDLPPLPRSPTLRQLRPPLSAFC